MNQQYCDPQGEGESPTSLLRPVTGESCSQKRVHYFLQSFAEGILGFLVIWGGLSALRLPGILDSLETETGVRLRGIAALLSLHALTSAALLSCAFVGFCIVGDYVAEYARGHGDRPMYTVFAVAYVLVTAFLLIHFVLRAI